MNRGLARRTVFETRADMRMFVALMARAVRAGTLEVHAFALLSTHFHLLVQSPAGDLGEAMRRIQNGYVRWFNRVRLRDGPLFRGRFCSRRVGNDDYRRAVVRYIDLNAVAAGLVDRPEDHQFTSAHAYWRGAGSPWLQRRWVENDVCRRYESIEFHFDDYAAAFHAGGAAAMPGWVEARLTSIGAADDELDSLVDAAPERVFDWMRRKAALADGTSVGLPTCEAADALALIDREAARLGAWTLVTGGQLADGWQQGRVVLLRLLCGSTIDEIGLRCAMSPSAVTRALARHDQFVADRPEYGKRIAALMHAALAPQGDSTSKRRQVAGRRAHGSEGRWRNT